MTGFKERLAAVQERVARAAQGCGRNPDEVRILPVSKMHPIAVLQEAMATGMREFGENRPQDLAAKAETLGAALSADLSGAAGESGDARIAPHEAGAKPVPRWVMIGNLQRNKAKLVVAHAAELQSLDSLRLAQTLSRLLGEAGRELEVMVQVNISGEAAKHGVEPDAALDFAGVVAGLPGLRLTGFMGVAAPLAAVSEAGVHEQFARLRTIRDTAVASLPAARGLSMGMSGDFEMAIAEGATCVRLGSALFGLREY